MFKVGWELLQPTASWGPAFTSSTHTSEETSPEEKKNYQSNVSNTIPTLNSNIDLDLVKAPAQQTIPKENVYENMGFQSDGNLHGH
jgi:hypothetical protein